MNKEESPLQYVILPLIPGNAKVVSSNQNKKCRGGGWGGGGDWLVSWCFEPSQPQRITSGLPRSGELRTQKLKSHLVRTQSLNVLSLKPGVGQYIAMHAPLFARDFFLAYFYTSGSFTCIFPKPLQIFPCVGCG